MKNKAFMGKAAGLVSDRLEDWYQMTAKISAVRRSLANQVAQQLSSAGGIVRPDAVTRNLANRLRNNFQ
ncbi:hypothetical protein SAMN04488128_1021180 [Chitinophaga eiseniae]|uniref:Uncharacterized protein n=1 Tax=Chitinophaga eiseniae TaxID=634771 RepID=A0A1T4RIP8_9BACT|nr:hypothetical protein SAMN04488128_1021180 [Chitinophaga eiseniae]